ncbi:uncharacterized protein METZ01_LOCUS355015 [marine metagenome]|uniref:Uncharacterized protein n=1 Tax=marine metagenome TaxID=408172 RepID=A0A382RZT0_9ZZZZ
MALMGKVLELEMQADQMHATKV